MDPIARVACVFGQLLGVHCAPGNGQSTFDPASRPAALINDLHWWMYFAYGAVDALLLGVLGWALWRGVRHRREQGAEPAPRSPRGERRLLHGATLALLATAAILLGSFTAGIAITRAIALDATGALKLEVIGHQWWWEIRYLDARGARQFATANEIHIPVGRAIQARFASADVIHSFWVPNLHGKQDLVPGLHTSLIFAAERAGIYRGQCAEFCGLQHAHMALLIIAEPQERFAAWFADQARPAIARGPEGEAAFVAAGCAECHAIRGTDANGRRGPDLTHVASRRMLAAGTISNTEAGMLAWIRDPQAFKPGTQMPTSEMGPDGLALLAEYLQALH